MKLDRALATSGLGSLVRWQRLKGFSLYQQTVGLIAQARFCTACPADSPSRIDGNCCSQVHEHWTVGVDKLGTLKSLLCDKFYDLARA